MPPQAPFKIAYARPLLIFFFMASKQLQLAVVLIPRITDPTVHIMFPGYGKPETKHGHVTTVLRKTSVATCT